MNIKIEGKKVKILCNKDGYDYAYCIHESQIRSYRLAVRKETMEEGYVTELSINSENEFFTMQSYKTKEEATKAKKQFESILDGIIDRIAIES